TNGVNVNDAATATPGTIVVYLRGLDIEGTGPSGISPGVMGINFTSGAALHVEKCLIRGFTARTDAGIRFVPNSDAFLTVQDTVLTENGTAAAGGNILLAPTGNHAVNVTLQRVQMNNGGVGIRADGTGASPLRVEIANSEASNNIFNGYTATAATGKVTMMIKNSVASNNANIGATAIGANAKLLLGDSVISGNGTGV